jgi:type IX secretion system PorP/SprF family membrane protein
MRKYFVVFIFIHLSAQFLSSQAPAFSQYHLTPALVNPAYVSVTNGVDFQGGFRRQWGQIQQGLDMSFARINMRFCHSPIGIGIGVKSVNEPTFGYQESEAGLQIAVFGPQQINGRRNNKYTYHAGFQANLANHRLDFSKLVFSGQLDPVFGITGQPSSFFRTNGSSTQRFDVGGAALLRAELGKHLWPASIGISLLHLVGSRNISFYGSKATQRTRMTFHTSLSTPIKIGLINPRDNAPLYINWLFRFEKEQMLMRTTTGSIFEYERVYLGTLYQWNRNPFTGQDTHELVFTIGGSFQLTPKCDFLLSYAYNGTLSGLGQISTQGAHELIFSIRLPESCSLGRLKRKPGSSKKIKCPELGNRQRYSINF